MRAFFFFLVGIIVSSNLFALPTPLAQQALFFYSKGKLINANALPYEGPGYIKIFRLEPRQYASRDMILTIQTLASAVAQKYPGRDRLEIGDIASLNGGRLAKHASHQNGLDADLAFYRKNNHEQAIDTSSVFAETFVKNGRVSSNFDAERNWYAIQKLASLGNIDRIFVDPQIKRYLCKLYYNPKNASAVHALSLLQPLYGHDTHMHVRINCPQNDKSCIPQASMPNEAGCGVQKIKMDLLQNSMFEPGC